jgi:flagellar hook-associated protein 2
MSSLSSIGGNSSLLGDLSSSSSTSGNSGLEEASLSQNGTPTLSGLASGLDDAQIIQDLLAIQQEQVTNLQNNGTQVEAQQSAFQQIQTQLTQLQSDVNTLTQSQQSVFNNFTVASSDPSLVTAAASSSAVPGTYSLTVNNVATASEIASQGFSSATAQITQGTLQISGGSGGTSTITINNTNDTLQGLADAINEAGVGISASIINDGSGSQPDRLVLTSDQTGTANAVQITNNLAADNSGATQPVFNSTYVGQATTASGFTGTSVPTANTGAGNYTGASNDTYTFTVVNGGTVGTDNNIQLSYTDSSGDNTGTITLNSGDANVFQNVAQGLQIELGAGTLVAGQSFSVKAYVPTVQQASNASVTVGSGSGALTIQNSSNQIDNLIQGVTVNLLGASTNTPVTLTVSNDTSQLSTAIQNFVSDYNSLASYISQQTSYDATTSQGGVLLGNSQATQIQQQLQSILDNQVNGLGSTINNLGDLGITFQTNGQLSLNQGTLDDVLDGNVSGVSLSDVQNLFDLSGTSPNPGVQFVAGTDQTQASATPYVVSITQAAQEATVTGTNPLSSTTTIDSSNDSFTLTVNGTASGTITLQSGTYTPAALAQEVQNEINAQSSLSSAQVTASVNSNNQLTITTDSYGSASTLAIGSGSALSALGYDGTETGTGTDVAGDFIVNGKTEAAQGTGQLLVGDSNNANTAGLEVQVNLTPSQVGSGTQANLTVTRGLASSLGVAINSLLDPTSGTLTTINAGFTTTETNISQQITEENTEMQAKEQALVQEFAAMEEAVSQLKTIGNFLTDTFNNNSSSSSSSSS